MPNPKAKTVQLLLNDGTLNGVINIADSAWNPGEMYAAPRDAVDELASIDKYGVYLLLSDSRVYVGQAQDLQRRIKQHLSGKDWWERVVLLTTQDDSFTRTDIDYLESVLIKKAEKTKSLDSDNKNKGNNPKVDKFRKVTLDQYLDEALFLMELIGVNVFSNVKRKKIDKKTQTITISHNSGTKEEGKIEKPILPDRSLKVGVYVRTAMHNLQKSGHKFTDEQISCFGSVEGSRYYTTRNLPLIWVLKDGEVREDLEKDIYKRYYSEEFHIGDCRFLFYSQWYTNRKHGATMKEFNDWYDTL